MGEAAGQTTQKQADSQPVLHREIVNALRKIHVKSNFSAVIVIVFSLGCLDHSQFKMKLH